MTKKTESAADTEPRRRRSLEERIEEARQRADAAKRAARERDAEVRALERAAKKNERKERTHRLITLGATVEKELSIKTPAELDFALALMRKSLREDGIPVLVFVIDELAKKRGAVAAEPA